MESKVSSGISLSRYSTDASMKRCEIAGEARPLSFERATSRTFDYEPCIRIVEYEPRVRSAGSIYRES